MCASAVYGITGYQFSHFQCDRSEKQLVEIV